MKHKQDLSDEAVKRTAHGDDGPITGSHDYIMLARACREIQRRRARDAGDAAARALADAVVACVHDSVYGRWFISMERPELRAYRAALAAERKTERDA